jgi:type I restriction enzyme R subunit
MVCATSFANVFMLGWRVKNYRAKVEKKVKELAEQHPTILKIKNDEMLTEKDLLELEKALNSPELYISEENLRKIYSKNRGSLVLFIKSY